MIHADSTTLAPLSGAAGLTGYAHPGYAAGLAEFGEPRLLPRSRAWVLQRRIGASGHRDAMGCYPLFACPDWHGLSEDLAGLAGELVSLTVVTDPFAPLGESEWRVLFPDLVLPFKEHFIVDLARRPEEFVIAHHRHNARKGQRLVQTRRLESPGEFVDTWTGLYGNLVERHHIKGISGFSRASFAQQLAVPGMVVFEASLQGESVGALLWYADQQVAYYHLGAFSPAGYAAHASFALWWLALQHFAAAGLRWLVLGAGAGAASGKEDGLTRFKRGWSTGTRPVYLCGRVFDPQAYQDCCQVAGVTANGYFPAYRKGEFS